MSGVNSNANGRIALIAVAALACKLVNRIVLQTSARRAEQHPL